MNALKEHVFSTILEVVNQKKIEHRQPTHALYNGDLCPALADYSVKEVSAALNALCKEGRVQWGHIMHDKYFLPL